VDGCRIISHNTENEAAVLEKINTAYAGLNDVFPLETEFLSEKVAKLNEQDR
jgi:hypothetical protein